MECPKCGFERHPGHAECHKCGIIYVKYEASMAKKTEEAAKQRSSQKLFKIKITSLKRKVTLRIPLMSQFFLLFQPRKKYKCY